MFNIIATKGFAFLRRLETKNIKYLLFFALLFFLFINFSCMDDNKPCIPCPPYAQTMFLTKYDSTTTEAWMHLRTIDNTDRGVIRIVRDRQNVVASYEQQRTSLAYDTTVYDDSLLPQRVYTYKAYKWSGTTLIDSSNELRVKTMDTTSHNFAWTFDTLGDGNASILNDIVIVNDTLAYAVGNIQILDSTNEFVLHNLAVWNGKTWQVKRIGLPRYGWDCSLVSHTPPDLSTIFQFPSGKVIISSGAGTMALLNDTGIINYPCYPISLRNGSISRIWGSSENNIYCVGRNGTLGHYENGIWKKLESGTNLDIQDIWGAKNNKTGETEILALASAKFTGYGKLIFKISGETITILPDSGLRSSLSGMWFIPGKLYYIVGDGVHHKNDVVTTSPWTILPWGTTSHYYQESVRGQSINDIVVVCDYGDILHYNGFRWKSYLQATYIDGIYHSVAIKDNIIIAVGEINNCAIVAIGRRN